VHASEGTFEKLEDREYGGGDERHEALSMRSVLTKR
jgi:hypothetical protein